MRRIFPNIINSDFELWLKSGCFHFIFSDLPHRNILNKNTLHKHLSLTFFLLFLLIIRPRGFLIHPVRLRFVLLTKIMFMNISNYQNNFYAQKTIRNLFKS